MTEAQKFKQPIKKKPKKEDAEPTTPVGLSSEKKKKLEVLDEFIEGVLQ